MKKNSAELCFIPGNYPSGQNYPMNARQTILYPPNFTNMHQPPPPYPGQETKQPFEPQQ